MRTATLAYLITLSLVLAACGDTETSSGTTTTSTGGSGGTTSAGGEGGSDTLVCDAPFLTKGPWSLAIDATHAKIRWEACSPDATPGIHFQKESGGAEQSAPSTAKPITLATTYKAALNPSAAPDYAGTYYTHEAALEGLEPGACYAYSLDADATRTGRFCTARPTGQDVRFLAIGDTNPGLGHTAGVLANVLPEKPEFTLHGGDIEYYDSGLETWASWFPVMEPMLAAGAFFPAIGNHESEKSSELSDYALRFFGGAGFDGGETYYRFENAGVHFFSLNTQDAIGQGSAQSIWLEARLAEAEQTPGFRFSIVFFHRPLVTCGDTDDNPAARAYLEPIFLAHHVPIVLAAHMHGYERFEMDNGLTYVTTAGGGGLMGDVDKNVARDYCDKRAASAPAFHGVIFDVTTGKLSGKVIDEKGMIVDTFSKDVP
ncbi:MAG: metallophosphoesterase [Polyangiaceae bacterium]